MWRSLLVALLVALLAGGARAQEINRRNANFYLEQYDFRVQKPGAPLELLRFYNSRSTESGLFGFGWSTDFDTSLRAHVDGSILVYDADGFILRYTLDGRPWSQVTADFVDRLIQARKQDDRAHGTLRGEDFYVQLRQRWLDDPEEREEASNRYPGAWVDLVDGTYISTSRGSEKLVKKGQTFTRQRADGVIEVFDGRGLLVQRRDQAGHGLRLDYDRSGRLVKVSHTDGASFTLDYDENGRVVEVRDTEGRVIRYKYDEAGNLVQVRGPGKRVVAYAYDDLHNLVAARLADGSGVQVQYDTEHDWAVALKKGGKVWRYSWKFLDPSGRHYVCSVTDPEGRTTRYEYDEVEHLVITTEPDGSVTRAVYAECCSKPVEVRGPKGTTRYTYDELGRLVRASQPDGLVVTYSYEGDLSRITEVTYSDGRRYRYTYDSGGRITHVESGSRSLDLDYGSNGKVSLVRGSDGSTYRFEYDADGRPVRISSDAGITLALSYDLAGQLVESRIAVPNPSEKQRFYRELREVLDMLEPATGEL